MVLDVSQRLAGRDDDGFAGMNAQRVHILHVADGNAVIVAIAHHLVLNLFVVMQIALDQDLRSKGERARYNLFQLFMIVCDARSLSAQRKTGPYHHRKADLRPDAQGIFKCFRAAALRRRDTYLV